MENLYKNTFDKFAMDENASEKIRKKIESTPSVAPTHVALKIAIAAAAVIAALMIIPQSRSYIVNAAQRIAQVFSFANGENVTVITEENETLAEMEYDPEFSYISVEDGRVFFVLDDIHEDITEKIGGNDYFRYEKSNADNGRSVILIGEGGTEGTYGWIELVFDANGNYVTNRMSIPVSPSFPANIEWHDIAMHNEGVPCGNPEYDDLLP